ncbi:GNAT family N-acetyltransferase [Sabulibacter ruber]|uniref:GNAT family N-acetyltransferase n=1 Tax=Sabulibacter ruber TaxID=2811901 RepID=UPI001A97A6E5|nr:GNAT family N-acetyltransferase [Sabulibacter ruber]
MHFREANVSDIPQIQRVRHSVKENVLSDPSKVTDQDCEEYITQRGKGWVCEEAGVVVGFSIISLQDHNVWALFVDPTWEGKSMGRTLHHLMLDWYFSQTNHPVWLSTESGSRAASFYRKAGWTEVGPYGNNEIKFEMTPDAWLQHRPAQGGV